MRSDESVFPQPNFNLRPGHTYTHTCGRVVLSFPLPKAHKPPETRVTFSKSPAVIGSPYGILPFLSPTNEVCKGDVFTGVCLSRGRGEGGSVPACITDYMTGGSLSKGSLSRGGFGSRGRGSLSRGGFCSGGRGSLSRGRGSLSRGVSVRETTPYGKEQAVRMSLE